MLRRGPRTLATSDPLQKIRWNRSRLPETVAGRCTLAARTTEKTTKNIKTSTKTPLDTLLSLHKTQGWVSDLARLLKLNVQKQTMMRRDGYLQYLQGNPRSENHSGQFGPTPTQKEKTLTGDEIFCTIFFSLTDTSANWTQAGL